MSLEKVSAGDTMGAIHELKRWAFFSEDEASGPLSFFESGMLYKASQNWPAAAQQFSAASNFLGLDSLYFEARFETGLAYFYSEKWEDCVPEFRMAFQQENFPHLKEKALLHLCLAENMRGNWEAGSELAESIYDMHSIDFTSLDNLYAEASFMRMKNAKKAEVLSYLLPGLGVLYAGSPGKALLSFGLFTGFSALTLAAVLEGNFFFGILSGLSLAQKFYMGNGLLAKKIAISRNAWKVREKAKEINRNILNSLPGGL